VAPAGRTTVVISGAGGAVALKPTPLVAVNWGERFRQPTRHKGVIASATIRSPELTETRAS